MRHVVAVVLGLTTAVAVLGEDGEDGGFGSLTPDMVGMGDEKDDGLGGALTLSAEDREEAGYNGERPDDGDPDFEDSALTRWVNKDEKEDREFVHNLAIDASDDNQRLVIKPLDDIKPDEAKWTKQERFALLEPLYKSPLDAPTYDVTDLAAHAGEKEQQDWMVRQGLAHDGDAPVDGGPTDEENALRKSMEKRAYATVDGAFKNQLLQTNGAVKEVEDFTKQMSGLGEQLQASEDAMQKDMSIDKIGAASTMAALQGAERMEDLKPMDLTQEAGHLYDHHPAPPTPLTTPDTNTGSVAGKSLLLGGLQALAELQAKSGAGTSSQSQTSSGTRTQTANKFFDINIPMSSVTPKSPKPEQLGIGAGDGAQNNAMGEILKGLGQGSTYLQASVLPALIRGWMRSNHYIEDKFHATPILSHDVPSPKQDIFHGPGDDPGGAQAELNPYLAALSNVKDVPMWWKHSGAHVAPPWFQGNAPPNRAHLGRAAVNVPSPPFRDSPYKSTILDYWTGKRSKYIPPTPKAWPQHHPMAGPWNGDGAMRCACPGAPQLMCDCQGIEYNGMDLVKPKVEPDANNPQDAYKELFVTGGRKVLANMLTTPYPEMAMMGALS